MQKGGLKVKASVKLAAMWFQKVFSISSFFPKIWKQIKAAELGNGASMARYAHCLQTGIGTDGDLKAA